MSKTNSPNKIVREFKILLFMNKLNIKHKNIIKLKSMVYNIQSDTVILILNYFGGINPEKTSLFDFFISGCHLDFGFSPDVV